MPAVRDFWRRIRSTRYTRLLESEIRRERLENARLRAENQALLNSILGIAGLPPVTIPDAELSGPAQNDLCPKGRLSSVSDGGSFVQGGKARRQNGAKVVPQTRRRSWHQVNRLFELRETLRRAQKV